MVLNMWSSFTSDPRQPLRNADGKTHLITFVQSMYRHPCPLNLSSSLAPYSIPPSDSILTGYGVCFLKRQGYCSHGSVHLMPWTGGSFLLALLLTRRRFVFRAFFSIYEQHFPSLSTISTLLIFWRERPSPTFRQLHFRRLIRCCL